MRAIFIVSGLLLAACVQRVYTPRQSDHRQLVFELGGVFTDVQRARLSFTPHRIDITSQHSKPIKAQLSLHTTYEICQHAKAFQLRRQVTIDKLECETAPLYHNIDNSFADKLYFFPNNAHCQVGRLIREQGSDYEVEFCGMPDGSGGFHDCVACEPHCGKITVARVPQHDVALTTAAYPFDPTDGALVLYELQVKQHGRLWKRQSVTLNGNGVLATDFTCLFSKGCQVRIAPQNGKCVAPERA